MATITKKELIERIAKKTNQKRHVVKLMLQFFLDEVIIELGKRNRLELRDFGVLEPKVRKPRVAQNPKTLKPVAVEAKTVVKFKCGRRMLDSLKDPEGVEREIRQAAQELSGDETP